jgi:hypothetical protein
MDKRTRRKLEMGKRALEFARAHPDPNPKYVAAVRARAAELERQENQQQTLPENGKVLPFRRRKGDPTDPAA